MDLYSEPRLFLRRHKVWLGGLMLVYAVYVLLQWSLGYIDFGDGNYMYIARRIAQGAVVYRDILAPQPPCHLFLGAVIAKLADLLGGEPLYYFRAFSLLLHLATVGLLARLAWRAWESPAATILAAAIYLWLPIGFWWSLAYQSEPLEIFFLLTMMIFALRGTVGGDLWAGVFAALAALTNATAAPFLLVLILYMIVRAPLRAVRMALPCILLAGAISWALQGWTQGAFWENVVRNQTGTFPRSSGLAGQGFLLLDPVFLNYAKGKMIDQGGKILALEGAFVFLSLVGFWRYLRESALEPLPRLGLGWFCLATYGSILYVSKGGTMDYIFSLAEPALALLAAGELVAWARRWHQVPPYPPGVGPVLGGMPFLLTKIMAGCILAFFALGPGLNFHYLLATQRAYELPAGPALYVSNQLKRYSSPDEPVLAPPFYAFVAGRTLWGDYSELFIWQMKYMNDRNANNPQGEGWRKIRAMAKALSEKELPIAILEMDQTGCIPEVMQALLTAYQPLRTQILPTLNTRLGMFVPAEDSEAGRTEQRVKWEAFMEDMLRIYGHKGVQQKFGVWYDQASKPRRAPEPVATPVPTPAPTPAVTPTPVVATPMAAATSTATTATATATTTTVTTTTATLAAPTTATTATATPAVTATPTPRTLVPQLKQPKVEPRESERSFFSGND